MLDIASDCLSLWLHRSFVKRDLLECTPLVTRLDIEMHFGVNAESVTGFESFYIIKININVACRREHW